MACSFTGLQVCTCKLEVCTISRIPWVTFGTGESLVPRGHQTNLSHQWPPGSTYFVISLRQTRTIASSSSVKSAEAAKQLSLSQHGLQTWRFRLCSWLLVPPSSPAPQLKPHGSLSRQCPWLLPWSLTTPPTQTDYSNTTYCTGLSVFLFQRAHRRSNADRATALHTDFLVFISSAGSLC